MRNPAWREEACCSELIAHRYTEVNSGPVPSTGWHELVGNKNSPFIATGLFQSRLTTLIPVTIMEHS